MGYRSNSRTELRARGNFQQPQFQPKARDVLVSWARAREYLDRACSYLKLARATPDSHARDRFIAVAQHYRALAVWQMPLKQREHSAHNRDRSSAFLAANSSGERMPFCCSSASRSMLTNMSISRAVSAWWGSNFGEAGGRRHPSASPGAPSTDTMGKLERLSSPPSRKAGSSPRGGSGSRESVPRRRRGATCGK